MKTYKYILFDWDGCLAKTLDIWLDAYKQIFAEYNLFPEDKTITHEIFGDWNGPSKVGITDIEEFTNKLLSKVNEKYPHVQLYDSVLRVLQELRKRDKKIALITTSKLATVQQALINNNLNTFFDTMLTAENVSKHKPDPEIVNKAIDHLQGDHENSIIIGDSKSDLGAAQNAGIDSILFHPKHNEIFYDLDVLKTYNPTYIIEDFKKILDIIK